MDACHFICLVLIQKLAWVDGRLDETEAHDPTRCVPRWKDAVIGYRKKRLCCRCLFLIYQITGGGKLLQQNRT